MADTVKKIYELQDIGKGIITSLTEDNLLLLFTSDIPQPDVPGIQDVINVQQNIDGTIPISVTTGGRFSITSFGNDGGTFGVQPDLGISSPFATAKLGIADQFGFNTRALEFYKDRTQFIDETFSKGLIYGGDYESNFTARSLITKQYVDSKTTGSETKINQGSNVTITGNGTTATPYIINSALAQLVSGITTSVTGNGATGTPYVVETVNLQKSINTDYTLTVNDNNYSIKVDNGSAPITITVPTGLPENFFVGVTQKGTADVTITGAVGVTITNPVGLKIKGQGYHIGIEQIGISNSFDLLADTKA